LLTASGVVIYLTMLPTDYIMPNGKITGEKWIEKAVNKWSWPNQEAILATA
jgi:hypothetical protein